ncbi:MAG: TonB-dependent receptor [Bacteroidota bacterium]|nr:TonB-dependent receptor [Bacteroidota bacterium]
MYILKRLVLLLFFVLMYSVEGIAQKVIVSGVVSDSQTNELLIGVNVSVEGQQLYTQTNEYGFYSITLDKGEYTLQISYLSYEPYQETISVTDNLRKNISLRPVGVSIEAVEVTGDVRAINIRKPEMSVNKLTMEEVKQMPVVLGEVDVLKSILYLPGVTNSGEGSSGFNVRGGASDQNLVLLDGATLYSTSHLFGFFSVFNSDAIKDLKLYKGGIPARFGGRLSSVLDIYQKEGNSKEYHLIGGIGLISSRLMVEGPIVKDKMSFLVAGRSSYAHLLMKLRNNNDANAYFYDLNTKLNYKINENNNLYLSGYFGRDVFDFNNAFMNTFGNALFNLRWNNVLNQNLFSNLSLIYTDYYYGLELDFIKFNWDSSIKNYKLKYDFQHYLSNNFQMRYGVHAIYYDFNPGTLTPTTEDSGINFKQLQHKYAFEPSLYLDVEQKISERIAVNYGLRYSMFYNLGEQHLNVYQDDTPVLYNSELQIYESATPIGTEYYGRNKTIRQFGNLEPRFSVSYVIDEDQSLKFGYNRMSQYIHLLSNTSSATPLDVWTPSGKYIQPQLLDQYAIGYFRNLKDNMYSFETEFFYKNVKNRIDYIDGADLIGNDAIERVILNGRSRAYGLELLFRKNQGRLTGFVSYTLAKSEQQTKGRTELESGINNGNWYKTPYDKLHDLSVVGSYKLNPSWNLGFAFTFQSGRPATFANGYYTYQGFNIPTYNARNQDRLPAFHHLDISATYRPKRNFDRKWKTEWVFGIYNLYNRKNASSISFRQNEETLLNQTQRLYIFGMVPSVTYNFEF